MLFYCWLAIYISAVLIVCSHHVSFMSLAVLYCCLLCDICDCVPTCNAATFHSVPHDKFRLWDNKVYLFLLSWGIIVQIMYYLRTKGSCCVRCLCLQHLKCVILFQFYKAIINSVCRNKQPLKIIIPHRTFVSTRWRAWHSFVELLSPLILLEASRRNKYLHSRHLHFPRTLPLSDCRRESF